LQRWEEVFALPAERFPPARPAELDEAEWALVLDEQDVAAPELVETLVRAQHASGADVVTCGLFADGRVQLFPGEPRALGLLSNGYGTAALVRRSLLADEPTWPLLARLSLSGARIVSVPMPLVTTKRRPATLETHPDQARLVLRYFERALPRNLRLLGELVPRLAAESERPPPARPRLARRVARRLLAR
jgi:hypothetical protein